MEHQNSLNPEQEKIAKGLVTLAYNYLVKEVPNPSDEDILNIMSALVVSAGAMIQSVGVDKLEVIGTGNTVTNLSFEHTSISVPAGTLIVIKD